MPSPGPHAASASVQARVLEIVDRLVAELSGGERVRRVDLTDSLERDLGISSLERVELFQRLEKAFGTRLPETLMAEAETPADLAAALVFIGLVVLEKRRSASLVSRAENAGEFPESITSKGE